MPQMLSTPVDRVSTGVFSPGIGLSASGSMTVGNCWYEIGAIVVSDCDMDREMIWTRESYELAFFDTGSKMW